MPYYCAIAEKDDVVSNEAIIDSLSKTKLKARVQSFKLIGHVNVFFEPKTISTIARNMINFFNTYIEDNEE